MSGSKRDIIKNTFDTCIMKYYNSLYEVKQNRPSAITLGKFDGIHRGHQKLLSHVHELAAQNDLDQIIFTFDVSPQVKLGKSDFHFLMTNAEKRFLSEHFGMNMLLECPFTESIRNMEPEEFVRGILCDLLKAKALVIGDDFRFGRRRAGDAALLWELSGKYGFTVQVVPKEKDAGTGREISSTFVREELATGHMRKVNELLGYDYFILGEVVSGMHLGTGFGFPTINIQPVRGKLLPPKGVYASRTEIDGKIFDSITNIGVKPTVDGGTLGIETFILDFSGDLYGREVAVSLLEFERPERRFASVEELKEQVFRDIENRKKKL